MNRVTSTIGALTGAFFVLDYVTTSSAFVSFRHKIQHSFGTNDKIHGIFYNGHGLGPCSTYYYRHRYDKKYPHDYIWVKGMSQSSFHISEVVVCKTCGMVDTEETKKYNIRAYVTAERPTQITYLSDYEMAYDDFKKQTGIYEQYDDNLHEFHCWYAHNK